MAETIYALQRDVDMIAIQINELTRALSNLDLLVHMIKKLELEQICQAAQMRRIEDRLDAAENRLDAVEKRLDAIEDRLDAVEKRLDSIDKTLRLIVKHLGIQS